MCSMIIKWNYVIIPVAIIRTNVEFILAAEELRIRYAIRVLSAN